MTTTAVPAKQYATIHGHRMAYVDTAPTDTGTSDETVVFLHGNPTSSYLWRNVIPHVSNRARCLAPDLIGMGDSDKLADSGADRYTFAEHRHFLDGLLDTVLPDGAVTLVLHDWGSALGFDWARRHPERVRGIAYMEAIVQPVSWAQWPEAIRGIFEGFRSDAGEDMILQRNLFIERVLPGSILRPLDDAEMAEYRRPFAEAGEARRPTLTWPRQIPLDGTPPDVVADVRAYGEWLAESEVPKLFINAEPGAILVDEMRDFCRSWPNQSEVTVRGSHFIQEDSPDAIGEAIAHWLADLPRN